MNYRINDYVRILSEKKGSINDSARVVAVEENGVRVSNLNMPFSGTFANKFFPFDQVEKTS